MNNKDKIKYIIQNHKLTGKHLADELEEDFLIMWILQTMRV